MSTCEMESATEETVALRHDFGDTQHTVHEPHSDSASPWDQQPSPIGNRRIHAMFCFESPNSTVGRSVAMLAKAIAKVETPVHIFSREPFDLSVPGLYMHAIGGDSEDSVFSQVQNFTRQACNAFLREFHDGSQVTTVAFEWSAIPAASLLRAIKNVGFVLSLHSMERQRSNLSDGISRYIEETELAGLREARLVLFHNDATADIARRCVPDCIERIEMMDTMTGLQDFHFLLDPGEIKGRFQVGPTDPTIVFVGDLSEGYGPDLLMKAMPHILQKSKQARCIFIGDGQLIWPLRIQSRYMLLDYAVRLAGHLEGQALRELIYAADIIVVPSRTATPWWPIEAAWAANRPVIVTTEAAPALVRADVDAAVVTPDEAGIAEGIDHILQDPDYARIIANGGRARLEERYSVSKVIARIQEAMQIQVGQSQPNIRVPACVEV